MHEDDCPICRGPAADEGLERVEVWRDARWRLTVNLAAEVAGFADLEPHRHIPHVTDLDGEEATTLGPALAAASRAFKAAADAEVVCADVFGDGVPHLLHIHLAPHREGDELNDGMIRGAVVEEPQADGTTRLVSGEFPVLARARLLEVAAAARAQLADERATEAAPHRLTEP
jgi:diadenosine tetraphosphate (Ap4A) HIT family hydrolase